MTTYAVAFVVAVFVALSQPSSGDATRLAYKSYAAIAAELQSLQQQYPDYVEVFSAQERYGNLVPSAGSCGALHGGTTPCLQWFIHITNRKTMHERRPEVQAPTASVHPPTAADYCCSLLVQVFFSGNLHGDEQVGPQTLIAMARLLLQWVEEGSNPWITRLVDTRHIWMLPVSNAIGYDKVCSAALDKQRMFSVANMCGRAPFVSTQRVREENGIDPNRDFPYSKPATHCMETAVARAINELWREHVFQLAITFHGGMQVGPQTLLFAAACACAVC